MCVCVCGGGGGGVASFPGSPRKGGGEPGNVSGLKLSTSGAFKRAPPFR